MVNITANRRTKDRIAKIWFDNQERIVEVDIVPTSAYQKWYCIFDESLTPSRMWLPSSKSPEYSYYRIKAND